MSNLDYVRTTTNEEFVRLLNDAGPTQALQLLYDRHSAPLFRYVQKILHSGRCYDPRDHSLDVGQLTWFRAVRSVHKCVKSPIGWLYRIARNTSFDHLKDCNLDQNRNIPQPDSVEEEDQLYSTRSRLYGHEELYLRQLALSRSMSRLSQTEQQVLWFRIEGHSHEEIAAMMNITSVSARMIFHRAKCRLVSMAAEEA